METIYNNFIKQPKIGAYVKVYIGIKSVRYGKVIGYFTKTEYWKENVTEKKVYPEHQTITQCVQLEECPPFALTSTDYFLDQYRTSF